MTTRHVGTQLLNDDGDASMATALMMSHHGFRRDAAEFARALAELGTRSSPAELSALGEEWRSYRATLHGHHESEDQRLFPHVRSQNPDLAAAIDALSADHARIDPLLEAGDRAFEELVSAPSVSASLVTAASAVVAEIGSLLDRHLATEERTVISFLRDAKAFPPPGTEAEAELYAQGFAWASHGVAAEVLERVDAMLPPVLASKLVEARAVFRARYERVWGSARDGGSLTSVPDWL
jgi:hemerythrin-like domain-containing protein